MFLLAFKHLMCVFLCHLLLLCRGAGLSDVLTRCPHIPSRPRSVPLFCQAGLAGSKCGDRLGLLT